VLGEAALDARHHLVPDADVGEGAPHHDLVVAAAGAVAVEVRLPHLVLQQVLAGGRRLADVAAGEMWSVVMESPSTASTRAPWMDASGPTSIVMPSK
jgi:hypothetical protein